MLLILLIVGLALLALCLLCLVSLALIAQDLHVSLCRMRELMEAILVLDAGEKRWEDEP